MPTRARSMAMRSVAEDCAAGTSSAADRVTMVLRRRHACRAPASAGGRSPPSATPAPHRQRIARATRPACLLGHAQEAFVYQGRGVQPGDTAGAGQACPCHALDLRIKLRIELLHSIGLALGDRDNSSVIEAMVRRAQNERRLCMATGLDHGTPAWLASARRHDHRIGSQAAPVRRPGHGSASGGAALDTAIGSTSRASSAARRRRR